MKACQNYCLKFPAFVAHGPTNSTNIFPVVSGLAKLFKDKSTKSKAEEIIQQSLWNLSTDVVSPITNKEWVFAPGLVGEEFYLEPRFVFLFTLSEFEHVFTIGYVLNQTLTQYF